VQQACTDVAPRYVGAQHEARRRRRRGRPTMSKGSVG
jgi:hypothetical protein